MRKVHYCDSCVAEFTAITESEHLKVEFCPFCATALDCEEEYAVDDELEDEELFDADSDELEDEE